MVCWSVCQSVGICRSVTLVSHAKNERTDRDGVWVQDFDGPREPCIRWGPDPTMGTGIFTGGKGCRIVKYRDTAVPCVKTAEPIETPFGLWARIGRGNRTLDGVKQC